jgi:hypothetical protein
MKTVPFDELPPYPVRSFTYHNEQARVDDVQRVIVYKLNHYPHRRRLRVASGATAPGPTQERAPHFRPKVVLMGLSSYILWYIGNADTCSVQNPTRSNSVV